MRCSGAVARFLVSKRLLAKEHGGWNLSCDLEPKRSQKPKKTAVHSALPHIATAFMEMLLNKPPTSGHKKSAQRFTLRRFDFPALNPLPKSHSNRSRKNTLPWDGSTGTTIWFVATESGMEPTQLEFDTLTRPIRLRLQMRSPARTTTGSDR